MLLRRLMTGGRHMLRSSRLLQIALVLAVWLMGDTLARFTGWPIPGSIFGMILLLALFAIGALSQTSVRRGANWFVGEMLLFFVPAVLALLDHRELISVLGLKVVAVIALSTVLVMGVTALAVDLGFRAASHAGGKSHGMD